MSSSRRSRRRAVGAFGKRSSMRTEASAGPSAHSETNTRSVCGPRPVKAHEHRCGSWPDAMPVVDRIVAAPVTSETERVRAIYERMAGGYDRMIATWERLLFEDGRQWVCSRARGSVLEIGVGTGRNLDRY